MAQSTATELPSVARLLAAGQRRETLSFKPVYEYCRAANIPGKGRGLVAAKDTPPNGILLLEPAAASGASYADLASSMGALVAEKPGQEADNILLGQFLALCAWGREPTDVPKVPEGEEATYLNLGGPSPSDGAAAAGREALLEAAGLAGSADDVAWKLKERFELAARANAFRNAPDGLGALAWHTLTAAQQRALQEKAPEKVPESRLWLFLRASLFNHSETPNACWLVAGGAMLVRAAVEIKEGEEVLLSYWPDVDAADAVALGLPGGFGIAAAGVGPAPELELSEEQRARLASLKAAPAEVAQQLADSVAKGSAGAMDEASRRLTSDIVEAEKQLPKNLRGFLEPRFMQAQLTLQQAAVLAATGDAGRGEQLRRLGLARIRAALDRHPLPWGKRVLLRLIFALKGLLRPAPAELLRGAGGEAADASQATDFCMQLSQQARAVQQELQQELEKAVEAVFGDQELLKPVLSKCDAL